MSAKPVRVARTRRNALLREVREHLRATIADAETELERLGYPREAWRSVNAYIADVLPVFGGTVQIQMAPRVRHSIPTREIPAVRQIRRHVARCRCCRSAVNTAPGILRDHAMIEAVRTCRPDLFAEYKGHLRRRIPRVIDEGRPWRAATVAAVAHVALHTADRAVLYAAGRYVERQRVIGELLRLLPREARRAVERYAARDQARRRRGGAAKRGSRLPHTELLSRALRFDAERADQQEDWLQLPPKRRTLREVVTLIEDAPIFNALLVGDGKPGMSLPLRSVRVDWEGRRLDIAAADGTEQLLSFKAIANSLARLRNERS